MNKEKYIIVNEMGGGDGGEGHDVLIGKLMRLRRKYPKAKILGMGEIDGDRIHPSKLMNDIRREMSDLP